MSEMSGGIGSEVEALRALIDQQGSRMSQLRWALERILDAAEGSSSLSWSGVADVARRALAQDLPQQRV